MNERFIRITHAAIFACTFIVGIITLGISGYLVSYYNKNGHPPYHTAAYRDRIRIVLVAAIFQSIFALVLLIGFQVAGTSAIFGILTHLILTAIAFLLFIIGVGSLTGLISKVDCGDPKQTFAKCSQVKALIGAGWTETVLVFIALLFILAIAFKARAWGGVRRSTLYVD